MSARLPPPRWREGDAHGSGHKGVVSLLQEFVQCSKHFQLPQHRPILQWNFDNRIVDFTALEFRASVAFLLDGIPHHAAGAWHPSKKLAQRDAAERALGFFVGRWGEQLLEHQREWAPPPLPVSAGSEVRALETFCQCYPACQGAGLRWSHAWSSGTCIAQLDLPILGVPHKFVGAPSRSVEVAEADTARRVLWYLQCPGYEGAFAPDPKSPAVTSREIPAAPTNWASEEGEGCAVLMAERKTALMRVQNRLQQEFARHLRPGQGVWAWSYETDEEDVAWPPLCRATVQVPVLGRAFTGAWARGQRDAQVHACGLVSDFLGGAGTGRGMEAVEEASEGDGSECAGD